MKLCYSVTTVVIHNYRMAPQNILLYLTVESLVWMHEPVGGLFWTHEDRYNIPKLLLLFVRFEY